MKMLSSIYREGARDPSHPMHEELHAAEPDRQMKSSSLDTTHSMIVHSCDPEGDAGKTREKNKKLIHTATVQQYMEEREPHPLINRQAPDVSSTEQQLPRETRRTLAQLRARKSPMLRSYLHNIGREDSPTCPLCHAADHTTEHLFTCRRIQTTLTPIDLWIKPTEVASLLKEWQVALAEVDGA